MTSTQVHDMLVIGSGPAGLTAAIYGTRAGLNVLVITGLPWGGNMMLSSEVENFPGFPKVGPGSAIITKIREQAERLGAKLVEDIVAEVDFSKQPFTLKTEKGDTFQAKTVIIATGAKPRMLGVPGEKELLGRGVSVCATCDGAFFKDKTVGIIGGGDVATEEAIYLTRFAKKVYMIHRRDKLRAVESLQKRALSNKKIEALWNKEVSEFIGKDRLEKVRLKDSQTGEEGEQVLDGCFIAIGYIPQSELFKDKLDLDEQGYIRTSNGTQTSVPGVFAAGDVADPKYQQAITSAAEGAQAAIDAIEFLNNQ